MVAARKATQLNPTEEDEIADVLRRRLFDKVDRTAADDVVAAYASIWSRNQTDLPASVLRPETRDLFRRGYPLHPETLSVLTEKLSSLSNFHRTRGMLRLLARTVHVLWRDKPADALAIHPHHIDPSFGPIRNEITIRLAQGEYAPALKADVASVEKDEKSAQTGRSAYRRLSDAGVRFVTSIDMDDVPFFFASWYIFFWTILGPGASRAGDIPSQVGRERRDLRSRFSGSMAVFLAACSM